MKEEMRKITVNLPSHLVDDLLRNDQYGLTEMIRRLMEEEKRRRAWRKFRELRGKVNFSLTYDEIKEDRE